MSRTSLSDGRLLVDSFSTSHFLRETRIGTVSSPIGWFVLTRPLHLKTIQVGLATKVEASADDNRMGPIRAVVFDFELAFQLQQ